MKRSYILLSLIVSQALCTDTDLVANFGGKGNGATGYPSKVNIDSGSNNATSGTDWTGSDTSLSLITDKLTFIFEQNNTLNNLIINNSSTTFNFTNSSTSTTPITATIKAESSSLKTLTIGNATYSSNVTNLGKNIHLIIDSFTDTNVVSKLTIADNSTLEVKSTNFTNSGTITLSGESATLKSGTTAFNNTGTITLSGANSTIDASNASSFKNDGGISLSGNKATLTVNSTLTNNGVILMRNGSSIVSDDKKPLNVVSSDNGTQGSIIVQGGATINSGDSNLTITNQDIKLQNLVSKKDNRLDVTESILELSTSKSNGALTLGTSSTSGVVNIIGEIGNTDPNKIPSSEIPSGSEIGSLILDGFTSLNFKNVNFKNVNVEGRNVGSIDLSSGVLGLENTELVFGNPKVVSNLNLTSTSSSTISLAGDNVISTTGALTVTGTHNFAGSGSLDFVGSTVNLGNGASASFEASGSKDLPKIGVSAGAINTNSFALTGLTLQTIGGSSITNTSMTLSDSTIEAIDSEGELVNLSISKATSATPSATINVSNGKSATLRGQNISITEQTINLADSGDQKTSLTLQAESGGVTLNGGENGLSISGKNTSLENNVLNLNTPLLTLKGLVTLENLTVNANEDLRIVGTEFDDKKGLLFTGGTTIIARSAVSGGTQYHSLTFTSDFDGVVGATDKNQAYVSFASATTLKASDFTFQNQNIQLANAGAGVDLSLYAYGTGNIPSSSATYSDSGVFVMNNTTFTDGSTSSIQLFSGSGGSTLLPSNLTLKNVSITSCLINGSCVTTPTATGLNTLNLSSAEGVTDSTRGSINILGSSTITASKFVYGDSITDSSKMTQGIGVDITVGSDSEKGNLTLTSTTTSDTFIVGGNLTLNNTASGTTLKIDAGSKVASTSETQNDLELNFEGGGITAIGAGSTITLKAKDFTFSNRLDSNNEVTASPFVKVQNTELELNGTSDKLDLIGTLYLSGDTSNKASLKATNGKTVALTLHDINVEGQAGVTQNQLTFSDSNIYVGVLKDKDGNPTNTMGDLTLKDSQASSTDPLTGTIASITLNSGKLQFQNSGDTSTSITLNADSTITSSGDSSLILNTIKVGDGSDTNLYSLNVTDGTFTLQENTAGTQLGAITLGSESTQGGNGGDFEYKNGDASAYQDIKLKGNLTSYGNSSITAKSFTISAKDADNNENYTISSTDGELKLIAQGSSALTATADITLNNGSLGYYGSSNTLASLSLDSSSSISSVGNSTLQANALNVNGASISASEGTLTLKGVSSSTTAGDVVVGNKGILTLQNTNTKLATLKIQDSKSLTLSADVGYITPSNPLGDGEFGQVNVQSLLFESKSGSLINIALNSSSSTSSYSDSLFALREGAKVLITTEDGIKKKQTNASYTDITLSDITTDTSGLTSITLTPLLQVGKDQSGNDIVQKLLLDLRVSQTNVTQLIESIKDANAKESMTSIVNSGNNALILESIMQSEGNAFKVGMAEYISNGNVAVVQTALDYINGAMTSLSDSMFASNKIYELIAMLKNANVENRMVRAKNPFMAKTQLASLVKSLVGTAYASSDDSLLLEEESGTPNYGEIWASFDGAMSFSQEESGNSSLYGFSAGYDTLVGEKKNYLLGFYASYGYGAYSVNYARNNSHNFGLGFYTRMSFENSEVDLILSQTVGLNHTDIDLGASNSYAAQMLKQTLAYNFYTTDIEARYGYVFKVGNEDSPYYFRPFGGINFALIVNSGARGDGAAELGIEAMNTYQLSVSVGVEMRKYFGDENYLYLLPVLQKGLLNDGAGANVGFYGAENIKVTPAYNVDTTMAVYLGGQGSIGENLAVNGGVGVKVGFEKKDLLTNWNVGLRYKF